MRKLATTLFLSLILSGNALSDIVWSDDFEDNTMAGYDRIDYDEECGYDYWERVNCDSYEGNWSLWCAGFGDQPDCSEYDCHMNAAIYWEEGIDISGCENLYFTFRIKNDAEYLYDYFRVYFSDNSSNWTEVQAWTGSTGGNWESSSIPIGSEYSGTFWFAFVFESDNLSEWEGAFVDNVVIEGDCPDPCEITIEMPDGGDHWEFGEDRAIEWSSQNCDGDVNIYLYRYETQCNAIAYSTNNGGAYAWTVTCYGCGSGDNYRVKVESEEDPSCYGYSGYFSIESCPEGVSDLVTNPSGFEVTSVSPNPFNPSTTIEFTLLNSGEVEFTMYNINGSVVDAYRGAYSQGTNHFIWNADSFTSGVYFIVASSQGVIQNRKCMLIK
jgi:hypothetical protein